MAQLAEARIAHLSPPESADPIEALLELPFLVPQEKFSERQIAEFNVNLDARSSFARVVLAAAYARKYFQEYNVAFAEVLRSTFCDELLERCPVEERDESVLRKILSYEAPHKILFIGNRQYDPMEKAIGRSTAHPATARFPLWQAVETVRMASIAVLEDDPRKKIQILDTAAGNCPGMIFVKEQRLIALEQLGAIAEMRMLMHEVMIARPTAVMAYLIWYYSGDRAYKRYLERKYSPYMIDIIRAAFPHHR